MKRQLNSKSINDLVSKDLWINKLEPDCRSQKVFLAIRDNQIDLYHKGGRLFNFDSKSCFKTHLKYASVIEHNGRDYLSEVELKGYSLATNFLVNYTRIKEN